MTNSQKNGRTIWDFIADHPKKAFSIIILLIVVIVFLALNKYSFKSSIVTLEPDKQQVNKVDKITDKGKNGKTTTLDTSAINQRKFIPNTKTNAHSIIKQPKKDTAKVYSNSINYGTQYNIKENNGIVGNNNQVNIVVGKTKTMSEKDSLLTIDLVKKFIDNNTLGNNYIIGVNVIMGNQTSNNIGLEIINILKKAGYKIGRFPSQVMSSSPHKNILISTLGNKIVFDVGYFD